MNAPEFEEQLDRTVTLRRWGKKSETTVPRKKKPFKVHFFGYTLSGIVVEHAHLKLAQTERQKRRICRSSQFP